MLRNYIIITLRNFIKNKSYSLINILGLSIGTTCCIIIYLIISHDLGFDNFHTKADRIYRVVRTSGSASGVEHGSSTPYPFAKAFRNDFTDVPLATQYHNQGETLVTAGGEKHLFDDVLFCDSLFFEVFDFEVVSGNPSKDLGEPGKVFLTESAAKRLSADGRITHVKLNNELDVEVVGIVKDPPPNTHMQFTMIVSMPSFTKEFFGFPIDRWGMHASAYSYVVLPESMNKQSLESRFDGFIDKYIEGNDKREKYFLQPLNEVHFDNRYNPNAVEKSNLVMLAVLGVFILSIACVNFINLATALAIKKSKEIGVRKTLGAVRGQLTAYFLGETFIITLLAVLLSLAVVEWTLPMVNNFVGKRLPATLLSDSGLLVFIFALLILVTLLSGLYPGLILSKFNPVDVLKNKISGQGTSGAFVRKALVIFQFLIAQALIIGTLVVSDQMEFFRNKPLGFTKDAVINVSMPQHKEQTLRAFTSRLQSNPAIQSISYSVGAPVSSNSIGSGYRLSDAPKTEVYDVNLKVADRHYGETYGLELVAGRWITEAEEKMASEEIEADQQKYVLIVNEFAAKQLGFKNPEDIIGKYVRIGLSDIEAPVVGVIKDFHISSLHKGIMPVVIVNFPHFYYDAGIKVSTTNLKETLAFIEDAWNELNPDYYFQYTFLDEYVASLYKQEERTFALFKIFSGLSIFIGCLGLYGLISFMANQKLKEVGIRKVMGASVASIIILFSKEFIKLIIIAFLIAAPLSGYFMSEWLTGFEYHIDIHWSAFVIGIAVTMVISLTTVSYRAIRAAIINPVATLRSE